MSLSTVRPRRWRASVGGCAPLLLLCCLVLSCCLVFSASLPAQAADDAGSGIGAGAPASDQARQGDGDGAGEGDGSAEEQAAATDTGDDAASADGDDSEANANGDDSGEGTNSADGVDPAAAESGDQADAAEQEATEADTDEQAGQDAEQSEQDTEQSAQQNEDRPRVVLILTGGLRWDQLDQTIAPEMAKLGASGAMANLVPISTRGAPCPVDTWLAISAGQQISSDAVAATPTCGQTLVFPGVTLPDWERYQAAAASTNKRITPGRFRSLLDDAGVSTHGIGNGAAYILAGESGIAPQDFTPSPGTNEELASLVSESAAANDLTVVDADAESYASDEERQEARILLQQQLADDKQDSADASSSDTQEANGQDGGNELPPDTVDGSDAHPDRRIFSVINTRRVERILESIPSGTRVVVVSAVDIDTYSYMQQFVAADVGDVSGARPIPIGLATSDSVRQRGVVQTIDIAPTILGWFGAERDGVVGGTITVDETASSCAPEQACYSDRVDALADQALHSGKMRTLRGNFIRTMTTGAIVYFLGSLIVLSRRFQRRRPGSRSFLPGSRSFRGRRPRPRWATAWSWLGLTLASVPLASLVVNMLPWWQASNAMLALFAGSWGLAAVFGAAAMLVERFVRAGALLAIAIPTALFVAVDAATGSSAMADSPVGFNLLTAARFYGVGNEAYALLATGVLLALAFLGEAVRGAGGPRRTLAAMAAMAVPGFAVAAIDALPAMGADFGGVLSFLPALLLLMLLVARVRLSWLRVVSIGGITVAVAAAIAFADWMRPEESRTHLGRFVQSILDGEIYDVLGRKLATNWRLLFNSTHRWVVLAALVLFALVLVRLLRETSTTSGAAASGAAASGAAASGAAARPSVAGTSAAGTSPGGTAGNAVGAEPGDAASISPGGTVPPNGRAAAESQAAAVSSESHQAADTHAASGSAAPQPSEGAEPQARGNAAEVGRGGRLFAGRLRSLAKVARRAGSRRFWRRLVSREFWLESLSHVGYAIVHWRQTFGQVRGAAREQWGYIRPLPEAVRTRLRMGFISLGLCMVLAFALNDSGIVLPGMAAIMVVPCLVALWLERLSEDDAEDAGTASNDGDGSADDNGAGDGDASSPQATPRVPVGASSN